MKLTLSFMEAICWLVKYRSTVQCSCIVYIQDDLDSVFFCHLIFTGPLTSWFITSSFHPSFCTSSIARLQGFNTPPVEIQKISQIRWCLTSCHKCIKGDVYFETPCTYTEYVKRLLLAMLWVLCMCLCVSDWRSWQHFDDIVIGVVSEQFHNLH